MSNQGGVFTWSKTSALNASADTTVNWQEGQAPSSINDSARAMMASVAKYRDDISGAILTTGTSAAYIVASNQVFDTLADFNGQVIAFTPHVTNAAGPVTVTVDGFANLPLRTAPGKELLAGTIIQGTPYVVTYNNTDGALYLQGFFGNPYNIPLAGGMDFWAPTAPNSSFVFPFGQAISRTTYAALFALVGTTYGAGDGSTTFNIPDLRGRVVAGKDDMGGSAALRLQGSTTPNARTLGAAGGGETNTILTANLPPITSVNAAQAITVASNINNIGIGTITTIGAGGGAVENCFTGGAASSGVVSVGNNSISVTSSGTTSTPLQIIQPTIIANYIMRII